MMMHLGEGRILSARSTTFTSLDRCFVVVRTCSSELTVVEDEVRFVIGCDVHLPCTLLAYLIACLFCYLFAVGSTEA